jgi:pimeloyl-ACP methyl ester carboxylesterase
MEQAMSGERVAIDSMVSRDGTTIGYRRVGEGPGLVVLHGAMSSGYNHVQLARLLADSYTVYLPDRRGRGLSGRYRDDDGAQEIEDLEALLTASGARDVFGVSSGGIVALEAALHLAVIQRVAVYEPPLVCDTSHVATMLVRLDRELAAGDIAAALISGMKGAQLGPRFLHVVPRRIVEYLTSQAIKREDRNGSGDYAPLRTLAPTLRHDFQRVLEASDNLERFAALRAQVLLLGGSKSPAYLRAALTSLEQVLPNAQRVEIRDVGHEASWNDDRGGRPTAVANELRRFFIDCPKD